MYGREKFIVISGQPGAGKDAAAEYLANKYSLWHVSAGDVIRNEAQRQGITELYREVLGKIKDDLDKLHSAPIVSSALEQYNQRHDKFTGGLVISGLRRVREVQFAKENGAEILFVSAPDEVRFQRILDRSRNDDVALEEHKKREKIEEEGLTDEGKEGIWLNGVEAMADTRITNDRNMVDFEIALDNFIQKKVS